MKKGDIVFNNKICNQIIFIGLTLFNLLPIIGAFTYCLLFSVNIPYWDSFIADILLGTKFYSGGVTFSDFFIVHNDFYPITQNIIITPMNLIFKFNQIPIIFLSYILYVISFIVLFCIVRTCQDLKKTLILLVPISFFFFNFYLFANFLWAGLFLSSTLVLLFAFMMFFCINRSIQIDKWFLGALIAAICCMFTFSAGIPIWLGGFGQLVLKKGLNYYEKILLWGTIALIFYYIYYIFLGFPSKISEYNVHTTSAYATYFSNTISHPLDKILCLFGTIGSNVIHDSSYAMFCGFLIIAIVVIVIFLNIRDLDIQKTSILYGMIIYSVVVSILLTISRSGGEGTIFGSSNIFFIPAIRHFPSTFLLLVSFYLLVMHYYLKNRIEFYQNFKQHSVTNSSINRFTLHSGIAGMMIIFLILGTLFHIIPGFNSGKDWFISMDNNTNTLLNYENSSTTDLQRLFRNSTIVISTGSIFKTNKLSLFDEKQLKYVQFPWINKIREFFFDSSSFQVDKSSPEKS